MFKFERYSTNNLIEVQKKTYYYLKRKVKNVDKSESGQVLFEDLAHLKIKNNPRL